MVFISYSHKDKKWCDLFKTLAQPLKRYVELKFWADTDILPNQSWRPEIQKALNNATVAVLLVSAEFLGSSFIADVELPYILKARREKNLQVLWVCLTPCHYKLTELSEIQAVTDAGKPLNSMGEFGYQSALMQVCDRLDQIVKDRERPTINMALHNQKMERHQNDIRVLAKPAFRDTYVMLCAGKNWFKQGRIAAGKMTCSCWLGDEKNTKAGDIFKIVAITLKSGESPPSNPCPTLPAYRTKSEEITVIRK